MLPETGLSMPPPNTEEDDKRRLKNFVTQRTVENYKFNIFSRFMEPLFKSYCDEVTSRSASDLSSSTDKWVKEKCDLPSLRPGKICGLLAHYFVPLYQRFVAEVFSEFSWQRHYVTDSQFKQHSINDAPVGANLIQFIIQNRNLSSILVFS